MDLTERARTLAIDGGPPIRRALLPYGRHEITEEDIAAVAQVLRSDWITTGPKVAEFENAVAEYVGAEHAVAFSSGTAALHGAAFAAGVSPGDEVVTTPLTFCATSNAVLYLGGWPVFADVEPDTLTLDPARAATAISDRTRAIITVDYAGHPSDLDALREVATARGVALIEDACHALGARSAAGTVGAIADMTVFSFHPVKHVAAGEGGMVTTRSADVARALRVFRNHGIEGDARERSDRHAWHYEMRLLGFNYRLSDIHCALGLSQLRRHEAGIARREAIATAYTVAFSDLANVELPVVRPGVRHAWHLYAIRLAVDSGIERGRVFDALRAENIGVNVHYIPVHHHPYYRELGYVPGTCPIAEGAAARIISLPIFPSMSDEDVADVVTAVNGVVKRLGG